MTSMSTMLDLVIPNQSSKNARKVLKYGFAADKVL
jgi:hypothetical protein